jgi:glycosyltransferase involved in cell wall biosynthesis
MKRRVTVVIPTINRESLPIALNSVTKQTFQDFEVIVVDDSVDQSVVSSGFRVIRTGGLVGVSKARNLGMSNVETEFTALLDDDDIWHKDFLERQLSNFVHLGIDFGLTGAVVNGRNRPKTPLHIGDDPFELLYGRPHLLRSKAYLPTSAYMFRTDISKSIKFDDLIADRENLKFMLECFNNGYKVFQDPQCLVTINYSSKNSLSRIDIDQEVQWSEYLKTLNETWSQNFIIESARNFIRSGDRNSAKILVGMLRPQKRLLYKAVLKLATI